MDIEIDFRIRQASDEDVTALGPALGGEHMHFYRNRLCRQGLVLGAWMADEPVAAVYISLEPADEPEVRHHLAGVPFVHHLQVSARLRCRGYGTTLLTFSESLLQRKGFARVAMGVDVDNSRVSALYERLGYHEWEHGIVSTIREEYEPGGTLRIESDKCRIFVKHLG